MIEQQVHMFAMCLNEERMIPFFLAHYSGWVTRFHIFDNGSTDASLRLLSGDPRITVEPFATEEDGFVMTAQRLMNDVWRRSPEADWVVTAEMDEHLHHPDPGGYLRHCTSEQVTAIRAVGFDMVADAFPTDPRPLCKHVVRGLRSEGYDKVAIFDPKAVRTMDYGPGRHHAWPAGDIHWEPFRQVKLLHYKNLGFDYVVERNRVLAPGLRAADDLAGAGRHYRRTVEEVDAQVSDYRRRARRVPGLSAPDCPPDEPTLEEEIAIIRASGLFDAAWYVERNADVADSSLSPVEHFCVYGCAEGRRPNDLFDPSWYAATFRLRGRGRNNALLDYILDGEARDRMPSPGFEPAIYRTLWSLRPDESAIRHALAPENISVRTAPGRAFEAEKRDAKADATRSPDEQPPEQETRLAHEPEHGSEPQFNIQPVPEEAPGSEPEVQPKPEPRMEFEPEPEQGAKPQMDFHREPGAV